MSDLDTSARAIHLALVIHRGSLQRAVRSRFVEAAAGVELDNATPRLYRWNQPKLRSGCDHLTRTRHEIRNFEFFHNIRHP